MNLIVVSDIFGKTESISHLTTQLSLYYSEVAVIDPYEGKNISFENEDHAYHHFQQNCGIAKLTTLLEKEVENSKGKIDIIGFSVGGTSAWELSGKDIANCVRNLVVFYSSRIREITNISPKCPTTLVFPAAEKSFDLKPVIQAVENKQNVEVIRTNYLHGFMNSESKNYSETGYKYFSDWLAKKAA